MASLFKCSLAKLFDSLDDVRKNGRVELFNFFLVEARQDKFGVVHAVAEFVPNTDTEAVVVWSEMAVE